MTFGILISGAIPAPFDLAMSTNSSKVTKEYLLSKLGLSPLVYGNMGYQVSKNRDTTLDIGAEFVVTFSSRSQVVMIKSSNDTFFRSERGIG